MKRFALAASLVMAVLVMLVLSADTAEGGSRGSGIYISGSGLSFSFGSSHSYGFSHVGGYPWRGRYYDRHGSHGRRHGGSSLSFSFGTGPRYYSHDREYYGRPYYRRHRNRGNTDGYGYYPHLAVRTWVPGGMFGGHYRPGYWEHRHYDRHDEHRDWKGGHRGRRRGRY